MKVVAISAANSNQPDGFARRRERDGHDTPSRALVVTVAPADPGQPPALAGYRDALFVAQLIAVKAQHPQTRERRRAEPGEAVALYQAATAGAPAVTGRHFSSAS